MRAVLKQHWPKTAKLSAGIILYEALLTWVYPVIAENPAVTEIAGAIPAPVKTVFGVAADARVDTFESFISGQFYARIWAVLIALYNLETANELVGKPVDDGSMAFLLSTPVSREEIILTQAVLLLCGNLSLVTFTLVGLYGGVFLSGVEINPWNYLRFGLMGLAFFSLIGAYSLLFSAWFAEEEKAFSYAAAVSLTFYALDVAGGLSDKLAWVRKLSLFQWYKPQEVLEGTINPRAGILGMSAAVALITAVAALVFGEKDLAI